MTGRLIHLRGDPHTETQNLLPWFVTGRLNAADRMLVTAHLAACDECRREEASERRLREAVRDLPGTSDPHWEAVAEGLRSTKVRRPWLQRPVRVTWFIATQAAVIVLCVGLVWNIHSGVDSTPAYRVLGNNDAARAGNVLLMMGTEATPEDVRRIIGLAGATHVEGPTAAGAYVLSVALERRTATIARLAGQPHVTLAQPIDPAAP